MTMIRKIENANDLTAQEIAALLFPGEAESSVPAGAREATPDAGTPSASDAGSCGAPGPFPDGEKGAPG